MTLRHLRRSVNTCREPGDVAASFPRPQPARVSRGYTEEDEAYLQELAARIVEARRAAGITVRSHFARLCEVERSTAERWEAGEGAPDAVNIRKIARVLKVSEAWLLSGFASPSWRKAYDEWAKKTKPPAPARIWIESIPLEGIPVNPRVFDHLLIAFTHELAPALALQAAIENADLDRGIERQSV